MSFTFGLRSSLFTKINNIAGFCVKFLHRVNHNEKRQIFYVKLSDQKRAVLLYKKEQNILDMKSIQVPETHRGQGLARLLAEAGFTYAIVNNYLLILTCTYMQKMYLVTKTPELAVLVIGPPDLLKKSGSTCLGPDCIDDELPKPGSEDT